MKCPSCSTDLYSETVSCPRCGIYLQGYVANLPNPRKPALKTPPPKTATPRKWRIGGIIVGLLTLFLEIFFRQAMWTGYLIYQQHSAVEASPGYRLGLLTAKSSPQLQQALGQPIDTSGFALGELRRARGTDFSEWWVRLKGPKGSGYLYGVANRIGNTWDYSRLAFIPSGGQPRIDLTTAPQQEQLRLADAVRQVYLVPLDAASASAIAWAHAYYKTRLGIDVNILPAISLPVSAINPQRRQIAAEKALDAMRQAESDLAQDPSTIMIGVTSQDMYLNEFDWDYSVNLRRRRFAIISTARLEPFSDLGGWQRGVLRLLLLEKWNTELPGARLQKLLSKNILVECFDLPLSDDYTSVISFGSQTWWDVDWMGNEIIGGAGRWIPHVETGDPELSVITEAGKPPIWRFDGAPDPTDIHSQALTSDLRFGLFIRRKTDFVLKDTTFSRAYRNQWDRSLSMGLGTMHTLDMFLAGQMGTYIELIYTNGSRLHFDRDKSPASAYKQIYLPTYNGGEGGFEKAVFDGSTWHLSTKDGWTYLFPYLPNAYTYQVTVLTGFTDPHGRRFDMVRDAAGDLQSLNTPSGESLRFQHDSSHRITRIDASSGRALQYEYDQAGRLSRVFDTEGNGESYAYDNQSRMIEVRDLTGQILLTNAYDDGGFIASQTLSDRRTFRYSYKRDPAGKITNSFVTDPDGYISQFDFTADGKAYGQSLPVQSDPVRPDGPGTRTARAANPTLPD